MEKIQTITVKHAGGEYPVHVGANMVERGHEFPTPSGVDGGIAIVTNETVWQYHKEKIEAAKKGNQNPYTGDSGGGRMAGQFFEEIFLPDGEEHKTWKTIHHIYDKLFEFGMKRDGTIVALGGGVVGDIAGFAAATYMRGVDFVQVPTTLLAQVDAAIGGKTGINYETRGKNTIGAFYHPTWVICDTAFLATLPEREYRAGLAEVVKYGLLGEGDPKFFGWLEKNAAALMDYKTPENPVLREAIVRSVQMKARIIAKDERETVKRDIFADGGIGGRALLNLGHTFAHAAEKTAGYGKWLHGEAVAAGLVAAAKLSEKERGIFSDDAERKFSADDTKRIIALLEKFNLPVDFGGIDADAMVYAMHGDKKFTALDKRFVVMNSMEESTGNAQLTWVDNMKSILSVLLEMQRKEKNK